MRGADGGLDHRPVVDAGVGHGAEIEHVEQRLFGAHGAGFEEAVRRHERIGRPVENSIDRRACSGSFGHALLFRRYHFDQLPLSDPL
ncbi:MAG TPA: hypothetical protein QF630_10940 [Alphaproteobacteria bacterium]|nr:hypothetical protein [Alphaproteobacteria bacterium]